ncbi:uncharacterized protein BDW43DRAFT_42531 [Aspergillus alliaceus]|uniref:uncharacterized protein n=1 Tax=Petromyces alliaceus TaxID=209559 RepID=UPI0012A7782C|nr:uncharacterized protein BDW43DRAFT_42531 [Aspergillus alliaceus]KAB8235226.1 hypothetical protein BDW43DRAFT_42531 [Aspergillus alliaceus]
MTSMLIIGVPHHQQIGLLVVILCKLCQPVSTIRFNARLVAPKSVSMQNCMFWPHLFLGSSLWLIASFCYFRYQSCD